MKEKKVTLAIYFSGTSIHLNVSRKTAEENIEGWKTMVNSLESKVNPANPMEILESSQYKRMWDYGSNGGILWPSITAMFILKDKEEKEAWRASLEEDDE